MGSPLPSPFTITTPECFSEQLGLIPLVNTVGALIKNLTAFGDFYCRADAAYMASDALDKPLMYGSREAYAEQLLRSFEALEGIGRIRAYSLRTYGQELTVDTARKILGKLIDKGGQKLDNAEKLTLNEAMDLLEEEKLGVTSNTILGKATKPKPPTPKDGLFVYIRKLKANEMKPAGIAQHLETSPEAKDYRDALEAEKKRKTRDGQKRNRTTKEIVTAALRTIYPSQQSK